MQQNNASILAGAAAESRGLAARSQLRDLRFQHVTSNGFEPSMRCESCSWRRTREAKGMRDMTDPTPDPDPDPVPIQYMLCTCAPDH